MRIHDCLPEAHDVFRNLDRLGVDATQVSRELEEDGIKKFADSFDSLLEALGEKDEALRAA